MPRPPGPPCSVCGKKHFALGLCERHYTKLRAHGDPNAPDHRLKGSAEDRFWRKVEKTDGCWLWRGNLKDTGYGQFNRGSGQYAAAHRFSYELANGKIPDGLTIDHLCRVRNCVRPDHLEAVPHAENVRRSGPATKPNCSRGHAFAGENLYLPPGGGRICRTCVREKGKRYRARQKLQAESQGGSA